MPSGNDKAEVTAAKHKRLKDYDVSDTRSEDAKLSEVGWINQSASQAQEMLVVKTYVKMRSDLFETYAVIASFFSSIGITVYYDAVAEEWIELREDYLAEKGSYLSRPMMEVSKIFACAGILHSMLALVIIVIGLVYMNRFIKMDSTGQFIFNSQVWFFGWGSWDVKVAEIANINLTVAMLCFLISAAGDVYNRVDFPYTHVIGLCCFWILVYILYFLYVTSKNWKGGYGGDKSKVGMALQALQTMSGSFE